MGRYDKTKNGTLDKNQEEWVSSLPFKPEAADQNSDGRISLAELITVLGGQQTAAIKAVTYSMKPSAAYDRLPEGTPDWFFEMDKNKDVQLSLAEYLNVRGMTEADADEFRFLDANNDGMATIGEIMLVLKEFEEERRRLAEEAQREQQRSAETSNGSNRPQNGRERHTIVRKNNEGEEVVEVVEIEVTK